MTPALSTGEGPIDRGASWDRRQIAQNDGPLDTQPVDYTLGVERGHGHTTSL